MLMLKMGPKKKRKKKKEKKRISDKYYPIARGNLQIRADIQWVPKGIPTHLIVLLIPREESGRVRTGEYNRYPASRCPRSRESSAQRGGSIYPEVLFRGSRVSSVRRGGRGRRRIDRTGGTFDTLIFAIEDFVCAARMEERRKKRTGGGWGGGVIPCHSQPGPQSRMERREPEGGFDTLDDVVEDLDREARKTKTKTKKTE
jgi:hypothetical protein